MICIISLINWEDDREEISDFFIHALYLLIKPGEDIIYLNINEVLTSSVGIWYKHLQNIDSK